LWIITPDRNSYDENMSKWNGYGEFISQADLTGGNPSNVYFKISNNRSRKNALNFASRRKFSISLGFYHSANHRQREFSRNEKNVYAHSRIKAVLLRLAFYGCMLR
jgi:hypothetical protein